MNAPAKSLLFLFLLVAAAAFAFLMLRGSGDEEAPLVAHPPVVEPQPPVPEQPAAIETTAPKPPAPETVTRTEVRDASPGKEYTQGVKGRVTDPLGNPVAGTKVYLMEGAGVDLLRQLMLASKGVVIPPVTRTETDESGSYKLGIDGPDPSKTYEVRVVSTQFVDGSIGNLRLKEGEWLDQNLQLQRGAVVYGRVTIQGSSLPVPNAQVFVKQTAAFPSVSAPPGREDGLVATVDASGSYRLENVPAPGVVNIFAVAPGYARIERQNVTIDPTGDNQLQFELPPGVSIAGIVTDANGAPVQSAKVDANGISSKTPITSSTRSGQDGRFEVIGLLDGPYALVANAPGFVQTEIKPVQAGDKEVQVVLESQGSARVKVWSKDGRLLQRYLLTAKRYFEGQSDYGNTDIPPRQARPDKDGFTLVEGLNPESYVFQVEADGHAKGFSEPCKIVLGGSVPELEVRLDEGGVIEGIVSDSTGQPLAGVTVRTMPNHLDENPFTAIFGSMIPYKITQQTVTTNAQGKYRLTLLTPGTYQLKLSHPDHYEVYQKGHEVKAGLTTTIPPLSMQRGTLISGTVRVDGAPTAQCKVTISSVPDPQNPGGAVPGFNAEAITDNSGKFVFAKRIPPGRYQVMGARQTMPNPLMQIADFHRTKQEITLGPGQDSFFLQVDIASQ